MSEQIRAETDGGMMTLTFARPEKKNAITDAMYAALADALDRAEADPEVRAVLFRGEGDSFSAGNDLADFARFGVEPQKIAGANVFRFLHALARAQTPLVAAVRGRAVGVGTTLLLHCDLVFVAEDARLSTPFVDLALTPEAASSLLLPARIGHPRAFAMFALGEAIDGRTAAAWGLANAALPADEVEARALAAAQALAQRPPGAVQAAKRLMRDADALREVIDREVEIFAARLTTAEAAQAFQAFLSRGPGRTAG